MVWMTASVLWCSRLFESVEMWVSCVNILLHTTWGDMVRGLWSDITTLPSHPQQPWTQLPATSVGKTGVLFQEVDNTPPIAREVEAQCWGEESVGGGRGRGEHWRRSEGSVELKAPGVGGRDASSTQGEWVHGERTVSERCHRVTPRSPMMRFRLQTYPSTHTPLLKQRDT